LRLPTHHSGSGWLATPFLCDLFHSQLHASLSRRTPHPVRAFPALPFGSLLTIPLKDQSSWVPRARSLIAT
jgi:hypothetical protein